jgi:hypothetical protein
MNIEQLKQMIREKGIDPDVMPESSLQFVIDSMNPTELDEELQGHIVEGEFTFVHHPLLVTPYAAGLEKVLNQSFNAAKERLQDAIEGEDFGLAVFIHARPYRSQAFDDIVSRYDVSDGEYWSILAEVWVDQENPEDYSDDWRERFSSPRPGRESLMHEDEFEALQALPEVVTIYRADISNEITGLSWTTDISVARWFSRRFGESHSVYQAEIDKENIVAYWLRRKESEVFVLDPSHVRNIREVESN